MRIKKITSNKFYYFALSFVITLVVLAILAGGFFLIFFNGSEEADTLPEPVQKLYIPTASDRMNLVVGLSLEEESEFVALLFAYDPQHERVSVAYLPGASRMKLDRGRDKLSAIYSYAGILLVKRSVQETFGITVDKYIDIKEDKLPKIIDAMGGIRVNPESPVTYTMGSSEMTLSTGAQTLDGIGFTNLITHMMREKTAAGDAFVVSLICDLINQKMTPDVYEKRETIFKAVADRVETDLSLNDLELHRYTLQYMTIMANNPAMRIFPIGIWNEPKAADKPLSGYQVKQSDPEMTYEISTKSYEEIKRLFGADTPR